MKITFLKKKSKTVSKDFQMMTKNSILGTCKDNNELNCTIYKCEKNLVRKFAHHQ